MVAHIGDVVAIAPAYEWSAGRRCAPADRCSRPGACVGNFGRIADLGGIRRLLQLLRQSQSGKRLQAQAHFANTLAPQDQTGSLFIVAASLFFAREREAFPDCWRQPNTAKAGPASPYLPPSDGVIRTFFALEWKALWPTIGQPPNDGGKSHAIKSRHKSHT